MEFRLLGPVEVVQGGRALTLGGRRQRAVLTHLLLHRGAPVPVDWLIEQVWAEKAPPAARASLHTYISRLRSELGANRLETRSQGYLLRAEDDEVDAVRLERCITLARSLRADDAGAAAAAYDDALVLRRGPALGDLAQEPSLQAEAARLEGLVDAARREQIGVELRLGRHAQLVPELEALVRHDPLQEDLQADLVLALYRCGRQADALAAYDHARRSLRDELGIEPSAPLRRLHQQVLRQDPDLSPSVCALRGFQLLDVLGQGSSAVVHRAVQPHTGREVALKSLHPWLADDPRLVRQFAAAAEAAMTLEHPHVVPLHDYWREPGGAYLAMQLMRGGNLADRLARGPLGVDAVVRVLEQVAAARSALRSHGREHGALRLDDVLLDEHGNAYLAGFNLAEQVAPIAAGAGQGTGGRYADVASLGHLLHELLDRLPGAPPAAFAVADRTAVNGSFSGGEDLCGALRTALRPVLPAQRTVSERVALRNPYKGLRAFSEADARDFFGRADLVERLVARLSEEDQDGPRRFLAVVGPSGSGKSSLVRAGLLPALRAGAVSGVSSWYVADLAPGSDPFAELVGALRRVAVRPLDEAAGDLLRGDPAALGDLVAQALPPGGGELLIVVDQFEELFTLVGDADRQAFLAALVRVCARGTRVRVVVTLRADFYDRPLTDPELAELIRKGTEVVVPLTTEGLEQAVVAPAERAGLSVEPALLAQVVTDVADASTALPLLQYALTELVDRRRSDTLTLAAYRELGGVGGALVRRADATYRALSADHQRVARQVLLQLVHPDASGVDTRRRVLQSEIEHRTGDPASARQVLAALGSARLVAFDRDPTTRAPTVEVAHEALLREWALLGSWLDAAREDLRTERRLTTTADEWEDSGQDGSFLPTGSRLEVLERWSARWALASGWTPTPLERAYLDDALAARDLAQQDEQQRLEHEHQLERRSVRRLRAVAAVLAVAVVGVSALTVYGATQRDRAERESLVAQARALAAASAASLTDDPERGVLLALAAVRRTREVDGSVLPEAEQALHDAVVSSRVRLTIPGVGGSVDWGAGDLLVTEGPEDSGLIELRDAGSGQVVRSWPGHEIDVNEVVFSADGSRLLTTGDDGAARLWDPATGALLWEHVATGQVWGPSFSTDGRRAAVAWENEGVVRVLDTGTGAVVGEVRAVPRPYSTALTHDGTGVAVPDPGESGVSIFNVGTGEPVLTVGEDIATVPHDVTISPDGRWLAISGFDVDFLTRVWSIADGSLHATLYTSAPSTNADFSPDSHRVLTASEDGLARVFDVSGPSPRELLRLSSTQLRGVVGVAFSPDGKRVLLGDRNGRAAQVFDIGVAGSQEWLTTTAPRDYVGTAFTAGGETFVSTAPAGGVVFRAVEDGAVLRSTGASGGMVGGVRVSPDGTLVAAAQDGVPFGGGQARVVVWDAATGAEVFAVPVAVRAHTLEWSADSALLAVTDDDRTLRLLDRTGESLPVPPGRPDDGITAAGLSPDGRVLVTAHRVTSRNIIGTGRIEVLDRTSGQVVHEWDFDADTLTVSPDGRLVAVAHPTGDIAIHDLATGEQVAVLVGHLSSIWTLSFSADSRQLASASQDATVRVWDLPSGTQRAALHGHRTVVFSASFSPDGTRLVSGSADGTVRVWAVDLDDLITLAEQRLTRGLSDDECRLYLQQPTCR